MTTRLDRLLANLGYGSRREVQGMVRAGRVTVNGTAMRDPDRRVLVDVASQLRIDGEAIDPLPGLVLMMHKPSGATCSHDEAGPLVYDLLPARWRRRDPPLSTVGRLDKETSGLLLLTDDGALLHKVVSPKSRLAKRYLADLARPLGGDETAIFAAGTLMLNGEREPLRPAVLDVLAPTRAAITITEGRYHQVRRMFAAVGNHVVALHRDRIGALDLPEDLPTGIYRVLEPSGVTRMLTATRDDSVPTSPSIGDGMR